MKTSVANISDSRARHAWAMRTPCARHVRAMRALCARYAHIDKIVVHAIYIYIYIYI